ncbi:IS3 family transposase [Pedobacter agri]|uniref:IS3 family transposase n=1 Tax=Pedobacter agri TaxID=454586 RepID=UPI00292F79B0|nr:IS3 family transposase [Pedobacter agri]
MFGFTRQAYYQLQKYEYKCRAQSHIVLEMIKNERIILPGIGGRKVLSLIGAEMKRENITMGRDAFFDLLRENHLLIRHYKIKIITTNSRHWYRKYPNLIRGIQLIHPHQLWVSDITYVATIEGYLYLSLITDAYSRKIIGWNISNKLEADDAVSALEMALNQLPADKAASLIHHSDRGVQYCCDKYISKLRSFSIHISMTENSDPLENAIAERVNGILKIEWLNRSELTTKYDTALKISGIIEAYNTKRPHLSINMMTPEAAHTSEGNLPIKWKNYWKENQNKIMYDERNKLPTLDIQSQLSKA